MAPLTTTRAHGHHETRTVLVKANTEGTRALLQLRVQMLHDRAGRAIQSDHG